MLQNRGGKYLHRVIEQPDMSITRPTQDSAKEGIFNSLGLLRGLSFLDLFSGSGQMAIEAFSRGAEKVVANDLNRSAYNIIQGNLKKLGINEIKTYNLDYKNCLRRLSENNEKFDIVFLDPPYKMIVDENFINELLSYNIMNEDFRIVIETDYELDEELFNSFSIKKLKYGRSLMYVLRRL